jgi:hypothetical protein
MGDQWRAPQHEENSATFEPIEVEDLFLQQVQDIFSAPPCLSICRPRAGTTNSPTELLVPKGLMANTKLHEEAESARRSGPVGKMKRYEVRRQ